MKRLVTALIMFLVSLAPMSAYALKNPAAVYCVTLGYEYRVEKDSAGDVGYCLFPNSQKVDAWKFLRGEIAQDKSYCTSKGYGQRTVKDLKKCIRLMSETCTICILPDGKEVEATELMGLILDETTCGDGVCSFPENYKTCPKDCTSGSRDGYCEGVKDGTCDPDCTTNEDPDCR